LCAAWREHGARDIKVQWPPTVCCAAPAIERLECGPETGGRRRNTVHHSTTVRLGCGIICKLGEAIKPSTLGTPLSTL